MIQGTNIHKSFNGLEILKGVDISVSAGEVVSIAGPAPLAVVVGRADMTEVLVRGKAFDLAPVSRENVARFEVK